MGRIVLGAQKRNLISELNTAALSGRTARNPGRHSITPLLTGEKIIAYTLCTLLKVTQEPPQCHPVPASPHLDIPPPLESHRAPEHLQCAGISEGRGPELLGRSCNSGTPIFVSMTPETMSSSIPAPHSWHGLQQAILPSYLLHSDPYGA